MISSHLHLQIDFECGSLRVVNFIHPPNSGFWISPLHLELREKQKQEVKGFASLYINHR